MSKIKFIAIALGILTLGFASTQAVQRWHQRAGREPGRLMLAMAMAEELELTEQQRDQLRQIRLSTQKEVIERRAKMRILRLELRELLRADQPDRKAIEEKTKQIGELRTQIDLARVNGRVSAKSVLTAEQKAKMKELRKRLVRRRLERRLRDRMRPSRPGRPAPPQEEREFEG